MNSNLKIALALVVLVAAVIGITVITQYTEPETPAPVGPTAAGPTGGMPLVYEDTVLVYDPASSNYAKRVFPGFFEVNSEVHWATYLLRNERPVPVQLSARSRSCTACSQARLAVLNPTDNRSLSREVQSAFPAAVGGLHPPSPDVALYRRAETATTLAWQAFDFDRPDKTIEVPPAVNQTTPTWCILQLGFEVKQTGMKGLTATIGLSTPDMKTPAEQPFMVGFFGDAAERVTPSVHEFGTLPERGEPRSVELYYWSTTRTQAALAPPKVAGIAGDPFLAMSAPVPLSAAELDTLARRASSKEVAVRASAGYKFTVTLRRDNPTPSGPRELDIGPVERTLTVASSDGTTPGQSVQLKADVVGLVALASGTAVELGDFPSRGGTAKDFRLLSDRLDLELEPVNGGDGDVRDRNPTGVTVTQDGPPVTENGRKRWAFKVAVAPNALGGAVATQLLVFRAKTTGQLVRIPLKGQAYSR